MTNERMTNGGAGDSGLFLDTNFTKPLSGTKHEFL